MRKNRSIRLQPMRNFSPRHRQNSDAPCSFFGNNCIPIFVHNNIHVKNMDVTEDENDIICPPHYNIISQ